MSVDGEENGVDLESSLQEPLLGGEAAENKTNNDQEDEVVHHDLAAIPSTNDSTISGTGSTEQVQLFEWFAIGFGVCVTFIIVPYICTGVVRSIPFLWSFLWFLSQPVGIAYLLVLNEKVDRLPGFRSLRVVQWIDKDWVSILCMTAALALTLFDTFVYDATVGPILDYLETQSSVPSVCLLVVMLVGLLAFTVVQSLTIALITMRKIFVSYRQWRTMRPGKQRDMVLFRAMIVAGMAIAIRLVVSTDSKTGFRFICKTVWECCLAASSIFAIWSAKKWTDNPQNRSNLRIEGTRIT